MAARTGVRARELLHTLREDLFRLSARPLPPMGGPWGLRRLPHTLTILYALLLLVTASQLQGEYRVPDGLAMLMAVAQSLAVIFALFRPMLGWWLSLVTFVAVAERIFPPVDSGAAWPWTFGGLLAHAAVQLLVALRVPARVTWETLALVLVATALLETQGGGHDYSRSFAFAIVLFSLAAVVGSALRARREARSQLEVQQTRTAEERARRTLLEERSRIARELHDVVAHHMSVISIQAEAAPYRVSDPPEELTRSFTVIRENAVEALAELRRVLGVLRSEEPGGRADGAQAAEAPQPSLDRLEELVGNVRGAGLEVTLSHAGAPCPLPQGVELSVYRIVQEALSNVLRHAPGSRARVDIEHHPYGTTVRVANSAPPEQVQQKRAGSQPAPVTAEPAPAGQAPPESGREGRGDHRPGPAPGAGHGLLGMRERATMLGGAFTAGPTTEGGFEVVAHLPRTASGTDSAAADRTGAEAPDRPAGADRPEGAG